MRAAGHDSCWSASELCQMGPERPRFTGNVWERAPGSQTWLTSTSRRKKKKVCCGDNTVWHLRRIQSHVLVMLWISLPSLLVFRPMSMKELSRDQHFQQSFIKKNERCVRQQRSVKLMDLCLVCSQNQIHHTLTLWWKRCTTWGRGNVYHSLSNVCAYSSSQKNADSNPPTTMQVS